MAKAEVMFKGRKNRAFSCSVTTSTGRMLSAEGVLDDIAPTVSGADELANNKALTNNLWAYGKQEKLARLARSEEKRTSYRRAAKKFRIVVEALANDVVLLTDAKRDGWCSECLSLASHLKVGAPIYATDVYLCDACGARTGVCPAIGCRNMASCGTWDVRVPKYCAEHRHDIPGFEKATATIPDLADYRELLTFVKRNLAATTRVGSVAAVLAAGTAVTIASGGTGLPAAVGGAIGALQGVTGAAAVSSGLATLGGGSLAAGGLGMAGGTLVVAAGGSALAGGLGASVMSAYVSDDKSFRIVKVRDGAGIPVIVANGFLTEGQSKAHQWEKALSLRYPDSPTYELNWGSKDLRRLAAFAAPKEWLKHAATGQGKSYAKKGSKKLAGKAGIFVTVPMVIAGLAKNPWHTAKSRADKTGVALASLIARTEVDSYVLAGHSLGGRIMAVAAETLATSADAPRVREMHLLGAALGAKGDWRALSDAVEGTVYNYHSVNDPVLKYLYVAAQAGSSAVGRAGFRSAFANITDINVSGAVKGHGDYWGAVRLR